MGKAGTPLRVGFDGRALVSPAAGVRRYVRELFAAMATLDADLEMVAIGVPDAVPLPPGLTAAPAPLALPTNLGWTVVTLPRAIWRARVDVFHAPAYTAPPWGASPLVLTIHDVSYARHPEWYPYRRDALRRAFYRRSARAADLVIADSEFSRREIVAAYGLDPGRIAVVPLGVGAAFATGLPGNGRPLPAGVSAPYVLHVGDLHRRRNLTVAVNAVIEVRRRQRAPASVRLVLAGTDRGSGGDVLQAAREAGQADSVVLLGSVSDEVLVDLYAGASAFVYPSRYEGFGLPLLEAMACGVPVVAARSGAIPEVVGDAALLVDPDSVRDVADAIERLLCDRDAAESLRGAGRRRAARFTWARTAAETVEVYRRCVALSGRASRVGERA